MAGSQARMAVARGQPPHLVTLGVVQQPQRWQRIGQLGGGGAGQRTELAEGERNRRLAEDERLPAGDEQLSRPAGQQVGQRRVSDRPPAGLARQVVIEVVQDDEVRFGRPGREAGGGHFATDGVDHPPGLDPADPRRDLGRERGLADAAHPVHDEPAAAWSGEVGGPPAAFGRPDGQEVTAPGPQIGGSRVYSVWSHGAPECHVIMPNRD
jgi:hypothetical protein